jgi:hypothetical protein
MTVRVQRNFYHLRIYFGDTLHVHLDASKILGMQSWQDGECECSIEFALAGGSLRVEYDDEAKWRSVLVEMEKHL